MLSVSTNAPLAESKNQTTRQTRRRQKAGTSNSPGALEEAVASIASYDDSDVFNRRLALDYLEKILARWALTARTVSSSSSERPRPENPWQTPRVTLVSFGSFRLGVHRKSADLDVLAISPPSCKRRDFFTSLVDMLKDDPLVDQVHPISTAYTPVIKFILKGFQVDMLFARVDNPSKLLAFQRKRVNPLVTTELPVSLTPQDEYVIDDRDLVGLDEAGVRSMNGARVCQILQSIVPNYKAFTTVLKAVKEWAFHAGIYSNVLGFLGGINWAILVAWVCQNHPNASTSNLLEIFFRVFASWKWPNPVLLQPIQQTPPANVVWMPAWNPEVTPRDGLHIMPIITPAYPSMNSSYNVGFPQLRSIQNEMILACNHLRRHKNDFSALFKPSDFFSRHEHFLQVTIRASCSQDFVEWFRLVESRLRLLITDLETEQVHAWPFARFFDRSYDSEGNCLGPGKTKDEKTIHESLFFIALRFADDVDKIDLRFAPSAFLHNVNSWSNRVAGMDLTLKHIKSADLPDFVVQPNAMEIRPDHASKKDDHSSHSKENCQNANNDEPSIESIESVEAPVPSSPVHSSPSKKCRITD